MTKKTPFMGTTEVPAQKSAAEIALVLVASGATQIATDYTNGQVSGLRWIMRRDRAAMDQLARVVRGVHLVKGRRN